MCGLLMHMVLLGGHTCLHMIFAEHVHTYMLFMAFCSACAGGRSGGGRGPEPRGRCCGGRGSGKRCGQHGRCHQRVHSARQRVVHQVIIFLAHDMTAC